MMQKARKQAERGWGKKESGNIKHKEVAGGSN